MSVWSNTVNSINWSGAANQVISSVSGSSSIVGVDGQYFFMFIIEGAGNFLGDSGSIKSFTMEERMGGDVPMFQLEFITLQKSIVKSLHAGTKVHCRFGRTMLEAKTAQFRIQSFEANGGKNSAYLSVKMTGYVENSQKYLREEKQVAYRAKKSKEAIIDAAKEHFRVIDRTQSETDDKQTWLRLNTPAIKFIHSTWTKSYISDDNFLIYGVNFHRDFVITDLKAMISKPPIWILKPEYTGPQPHTASYNTNVEMTSEFGLMNQLSIYKKTIPTHSIVNQKQSQAETPPPKNQMSSGPLNLEDDSNTKHNAQQMFDQTSIHKNIFKAGLNNNSKQTLQNSSELNITIERKWQDYELFDLVMYFPQEIPGTPPEGGHTRGVYAITRISRYFENNRACTMITISRDGMNNLEGSGLGLWSAVNGDIFGSLASGLLNSIGGSIGGAISGAIKGL